MELETNFISSLAGFRIHKTLVHGLELPTSLLYISLVDNYGVNPGTVPSRLCYKWICQITAAELLMSLCYIRTLPYLPKLFTFIHNLQSFYHLPRTTCGLKSWRSYSSRIRRRDCCAIIQPILTILYLLPTILLGYSYSSAYNLLITTYYRAPTSSVLPTSTTINYGLYCCLPSSSRTVPIHTRIPILPLSSP